jgi:uncharacterized membrane protein YccC
MAHLSALLDGDAQAQRDVASALHWFEQQLEAAVLAHEARRKTQPREQATAAKADGGKVGQLGLFAARE